MQIPMHHERARALSKVLALSISEDSDSGSRVIIQVADKISASLSAGEFEHAKVAGP